MKIRLLREAPGIGDMIRCTAVATAIRNAIPGTEVHMWTLPAYEPYARYCPDIAKVVTMEKPKRQRDEDWWNAYDSGPYTDTVDLWCPAFRYECRYAPDIDKDRVELWTESAGDQLGMKLTPCAPRVELPMPVLRKGSGMVVRMHQKPKGERERPLVGLVPSGNSELRALSIAQVCAIGRRLVGAGVNVLSMVNRWSADELWGLVSQLDALVSVDTGPLHIAGVLGIPALLVASTTEGGLLTRWYPTVKYINPEFCPPETCERHCYYSAKNLRFLMCREERRCQALARLSGDDIGFAALEVLNGIGVRGSQDADVSGVPVAQVSGGAVGRLPVPEAGVVSGGSVQPAGPHELP